jgi:predicted nucleic acid-binding protein
MPSVVLDASVTLAWFFADEEGKNAMDVLDAVQTHAVLVPPIWLLEVSNALLVAERQERVEQTQVVHWIELLESLDYRVESVIADSSFDAVLSTARSLQLSAYDASYLLLALRTRSALASVDKNLRRAAKKVDVPLLG